MSLTKHQKRFLKELERNPSTKHSKVKQMVGQLVRLGLLEEHLYADGEPYFRLTPLGAREAALPRLTPAVRAAFEKLGKGVIVFRMDSDEPYVCFYEADGSLLNLGTFHAMQASGLLRWEKDSRMTYGAYIGYLDPEKAVPWIEPAGANDVGPRTTDRGP
jgi:hypothetical protein